MKTRLLASAVVTLGIIAGCASTADDTSSDEANITDAEAGDLYTGLWTNWYREPFDIQKSAINGLLKLKKMRELITSKNLFDTGSTVKHKVSCEGDNSKMRLMDGTCTDLERPTAGAAGTHLGRNIDPKGLVAEDEKGTLFKPDPREISKKLLTRTDGVKEIDFLNLLAASWIQFETHDWFAHVQQTTDVYKLKSGSETLFIAKSVEDPHPDLLGANAAFKTYNNRVTAWWDASQVYGSDDETALRLRSKDGKKFDKASDLVPGGLINLPDDRMPIVDGKEDSGFTDNWWVGISMMHNLFAMEHNKVAVKLKQTHPDFSDDKIFHLSRMVTAAVIAKIHTVEWTPAILGFNPALTLGMNINWFGFGKDLPGIVGNPMDKVATKVPYSLTEEFTSVYRLHSLLPENVNLVSLSDPSKKETRPIAKTRGGQMDVPSFSTTDLFHSFGKQHPGQITLNNFPKFLQDLEVPVMGKIDMGMIDIVRDRERGVPRYNEFRRQLSLKPMTKFEDLFLQPAPGAAPGEAPEGGELTAEQQDMVKKLKDIYGEDGIEKLDLLIGCLAEAVRPTSFGFGETQFQIFILMASRRLQADRFYTTNFNDETYTKEGIEWIKNATMKNVLLRNYPELSKTGLSKIEDGNAFRPWK